MTRIILFLLLSLSLTWVDTHAGTRAASAAAQTPVIPTESFDEQIGEPENIAMAPEAARKLEQLPPMKSWMKKAGLQPAPTSTRKPRSGAATSTSKTAQQPASRENGASEAGTTAPDASSLQTPFVSGINLPATADTLAAARPIPAPAELPLGARPSLDASPHPQRFLPTRRRIDREINKLKFAYKGEVMMGVTASYGTLSSDDSGFLTILTNIDANATIASVKPFLGYFYRDNNCVGVRFGYSHTGGNIDKAVLDLGPSNDTSFDIPYVKLDNNNYSFGIFHRSYAGLDPKGRFGLFAEFELAVSTGASEFTYKSGDTLHQTFSDNTQVKLSFNPGAAVYIFPNVCATLSFGLGGVKYTSVTQKDADGNKIGSRKSSNMKFKLNIAAINIGMTIHLWDKKKQ